MLAWADALVQVAEQVAGATSAAEAAAPVPDLQRLARQMTRGVDRDGDERITFAPGEAGLIGLRLALGALAAHRGEHVNQAADCSQCTANVWYR